MTQETFSEVLNTKVRAAEEIILSYMPEESGHAEPVLSAMNYSVRAGGKRLRPLLMQEAAELFGGAPDAMLHPFMAAIEMIHTYSLIHDDLPALDNDDLRRGRPTAHVVYGEAMAILAGDGLLNYAFETAAKAFGFGLSEVSAGASDRGMIDPAAMGRTMLERAARAMTVLAGKPGIYGMIGGQTADVALTGQPLDADVLDYIYMNKTSALIQCSLMIGGILAGASDEAVQALEQIGADVGMAFQIRDDILDVTATTEQLGKNAGSDARNEKYTYVTLYGMEAARAAVQMYSDRAAGTLKGLCKENGGRFLTELISWLCGRDH